MCGIIPVWVTPCRGGVTQAGVRAPEKSIAALTLFAAAAMSRLGPDDQRDLVPNLLALLQEAASQVRRGRGSPGGSRGTQWNCVAAIAASALSTLHAGVEPPDGGIHVDNLLELALWEPWDPAANAAAVAAAAALNKWSPGTNPVTAEVLDVRVFTSFTYFYISFICVLFLAPAFPAVLRPNLVSGSHGAEDVFTSQCFPCL